MANVNKAVSVVVAIAVSALIVAFLLPVALGMFGGMTETTVTQNVNDEETLTSDLTITLDSVTDGTDATYTVATDDDSDTVTADLDTTETATVDGYDVHITPTDIGTDSATATVEYPTTYGWGSGASALYGIIPVMIVLAAFLVMIGVAYRRV